jgi:hypothetical protein
LVKSAGYRGSFTSLKKLQRRHNSPWVHFISHRDSYTSCRDSYRNSTTNYRYSFTVYRDNFTKRDSQAIETALLVQRHQLLDNFTSYSENTINNRYSITS